jgi:hypothetical protein
MIMFRALAFAILLVPITLLGISPVEAAMLNGKIKVDITSGGLKGRTFFGDFSYDDSQLTRNGLEVMGVNAGGVANNDIGGFKTFSFNFLDFPTATIPTTYTQVDQPDFNDFAAIVFENGTPTQLAGIFFSGQSNLFFGYDQRFLYRLGGQSNGIKNSGSGSYTLSLVEVPFGFNPMIPTLLVGGFFMFLYYRKKLKKIKE